VAVLILKAVLEYPQKYGRKRGLEDFENSNQEKSYDLNPLKKFIAFSSQVV